MAGIKLDFKSGDIWFASVQKCFGLPAGLGILICSPKVLECARIENIRNHYNSLLFLDEMMIKWETTHTPNILGIYLLMRVLESIKPIADVEKTIQGRYRKWETFFDGKSRQLNFLIGNKAVRSNTVLAIQATPELIQKVKSKAQKNGFMLGNGYADLKNFTFRIANFPAIQRVEIARLMDFFYNFI